MIYERLKKLTVTKHNRDIGKSVVLNGLSNLQVENLLWINYIFQGREGLKHAFMK